MEFGLFCPFTYRAGGLFHRCRLGRYRYPLGNTPIWVVKLRQRDRLT
jgi:hypothetical protein